MWKKIQEFWDGLITIIGILMIVGIASAICIKYPIMWLPTIIIGWWVYKIDKDETEKTQRKQSEKNYYDATLAKAKNGDSASKFDYGEIVLFGRGVIKDEQIAMNWIKSAALMNEPRALFKMGEVYDKGDYQYPVNKAKACNFFEKAAYFGHEKAKLIFDSQLEKRDKRSYLETKLVDIYLSTWSRYQALGDATKIDTMTGVEFERFVSMLYMRMGYDVNFTSVNNDQGADIIAKKDKDRTSIQVKRYKKNVGNTSVQEAIAGAHYHNCNKTCVVTNSTFTKSAQELAKRSKTKLIDGKKLFSLIEKYSKEERAVYDHNVFIKSKEEILSFFPELKELVQSVERELKYLNHSYFGEEGTDVTCRSLEWKYQCPLSWKSLDETDEENVKYCCKCNSSVYFSDDPKTLEKYVLEGKCTASHLRTSQCISKNKFSSLDSHELGLRVIE